MIPHHYDFFLLQMPVQIPLVTCMTHQLSIIKLLSDYLSRIRQTITELKMVVLKPHDIATTLNEYPTSWREHEPKLQQPKFK